ncbi:carbohydrate binding domain-containing protein [uncultured Ruminococcus sp.]|uniref:carbohydrate binding domain-containing protein n=1 Tax=uncultured Ruminococcus sp. TaxID=165186 RepID=UPI00259A26EB|nr:carbohydrate binding domain-containing protein [uncultured Ruminococcus sp.]
MSMQQKLKASLSVLLAAAMLTPALAVMPETEPSVYAADTVVVNTGKEYQTIDGFGGMNHPEWTGSDLTDAQRQKAFGNGKDELGFTILRIFVNPNSNQWNKAVPTAKFASQHGVKVFASPWEPPSNLAESDRNGGKLHLPKSNYTAYAQHLNNFGNYMKNQGVDLYAISVQNEPDFASEWTRWSTDETTDFLANYADKITSTRVMSPESFQYAPETASWVKDGGKKYYTKILNNQKAFANCDLFGTHFYGTQRAWMDFPALESCGKPIWMTEVYVPNSSSDADTWPEALDVAENIHNGMTVGNMSAYVWWYIRRSYGPMKENGNISKRGYMMAQYSKFVRPGDVRIDATEQPTQNVFVSAYKNDADQVTIVAVNKTTSEYNQSFSMGSGESISGVTRYRSSGSENLAKSEISFNGTGFAAQLPAQSVSTFVVDLGSANTDPDENGWYFHDEFEADTCSWEGRGAAGVMTSGRTNYAGKEALLVQDRTAAWNGATKALNAKAFVPGKEYSFSVNVSYFDGDLTDTFYLKLQYTDANGDTQYDSIATAKGVQGKWVQLANTNYTIPAGAKDMQIYVETADTTNNFYIDEAIGAVAGTVIPGAGTIDVPETLIPGDVNLDGVIDGFDLAAAKRGLAAGGFDNVFSAKVADVNKSTVFDAEDVQELSSFLLKKATAFTDQTPPEPEKKAYTMQEYTDMISKMVVEKEPDASHNEQAGVQYGTVKSGSYYSTTCKRNKPYNILLPANYSSSKKYPVLYCMHGYWENQDRMIIKGNGTMYTRQIIGNAIAAGEAEDMIVVFPYIYSSATQDSCSAMDNANNAAYDNFINDLVVDLMPHIESTYSVKTGRDNTAITGFSMGGRESLLIGMKRSDLFGYVGAICPAPGVTGAFKWNSDEEAPHLLFITAGSNDTVVYSNPENYHNNFTKNSVPHIWHYVNGGYHGDNSIHAHMYNFVRAIFKTES